MGARLSQLRPRSRRGRSRRTRRARRRSHMGGLNDLHGQISSLRWPYRPCHRIHLHVVRVEWRRRIEPQPMAASNLRRHVVSVNHADCSWLRSRGHSQCRGSPFGDTHSDRFVAGGSPDEVGSPRQADRRLVGIGPAHLVAIHGESERERIKLALHQQGHRCAGHGSGERPMGGRLSPRPGQ